MRAMSEVHEYSEVKKIHIEPPVRSTPPPKGRLKPGKSWPLRGLSKLATLPEEAEQDEAELLGFKLGFCREL